MENRPKLTIELKPADYLFEVLSCLILTLLWGITFSNYHHLPPVIPTHFDVSGHANGFGNKRTLFLLPIIATFLFIALTVLNKFPQIFNYPTAITKENAVNQYTNSTRMIRVLKMITLIIFTAIVWMTIKAATGDSTRISNWFLPVTVVLIFLTTTYFLYKSVQSK